MQLPPLINGRFVRRDNRFRATVQVDGRDETAHVSNSGRLHDLFVPGRSVWLRPAAASHRKTAYDLKLVELDGVYVSVDARLPNPLLAEAIKLGELPNFAYEQVRPEVTLGDSRFDFFLSGEQGSCWVETKSVTSVKGGIARFPDAPTVRGRKHVRGLMAARTTGTRAAVIFVIQRPDAGGLTPEETADPEFATTLRQAAAAGVELFAYTCHVSTREIRLAAPVPVHL